MPVNSTNDGNQTPTLVAYQGTAGTADTAGTSKTVGLSADPVTGALYVNDLGGGGGGGGTVVQVNSGSIVVTAGTVTVQGGGTINVGTINAGTINAGTINSATITGGTVHTTGTIRSNLAALGTMTITLGSLATSAVGVGRQSTLIDNTSNLYTSAQIGAQITAGTATGTALISLYLIRSDGANITDDAAGTGDAAWTQKNAPLLGNIVVGAGTNAQFNNIFDTSFLGNLGPKWGIGVVHNLGNPLNGSAGSHSLTWTGVTQQVI